MGNELPFTDGGEAMTAVLKGASGSALPTAQDEALTAEQAGTV